MFYWDCGGQHIVLSDAEETQLIRELTDDPLERVRYMTSRTTRKRIEQLAFAHFRRLFMEEPEEFRRRYYWRNLDGQDAQNCFPVMLDAYARAHKLVVMGEFPPKNEGSHVERMQLAAERFIYGQESNVLWMTVFNYSWFFGPRLRPKCQVAIDPKQITRVIGCVDEFAVSTNALSIWFTRKRVRIFSYPIVQQEV